MKINSIATSRRYPVRTHSARPATIAPRYSPISACSIGTRFKRERPRLSGDREKREKGENEEKETGTYTLADIARARARARGYGMVAEARRSEKGGKGRRNIPMHRAA